jgi:uncharacterized integral membrane protein
MDYAIDNAAFAVIGALLLIVVGLLSWITVLLARIGQLEREARRARDYWSQQQRKASGWGRN